MSIPDAWRCLDPTCLAHGSGPKADLEARKHGEASGHGTTTHLDAPWWSERDEAS